jgi:hypothetical protein
MEPTSEQILYSVIIIFYRSSVVGMYCDVINFRKIMKRLWINIFFAVCEQRRNAFY